MTTVAIIVAAGRGTRASSGLAGASPKQWRVLAGRPVVAHALSAFAGLRRVLVIHPDDRALAAAVAGDALVVVGGASRAASVRAALEALTGQGVTRVLIHDAARPMVSAAVIGRVLAALEAAAGAAPALAVTDALWTGAGGLVSGTRDRAGLFRAQTPQGFGFEAILAAHRAFAGEAADDVEVARAAGIDVVMVEGEEANLKLTFPGDFLRVEKMLLATPASQREMMPWAETLAGRTEGIREKPMDVRMGNGFDVHAFCPGDHVWLCGVRVAHDKALLGHSDADVGTHALTDAIYGALAAGDIGQHFPPSDPQWKGADSRIFLAHAADLARARGFQITSADVTLICERPKIGPHALAMRMALAEIMGLAVERVSVKATTSERLGFTGREEGIAAMATAVLVSVDQGASGRDTFARDRTVDSDRAPDAAADFAMASGAAASGAAASVTAASVTAAIAPRSSEIDMGETAASNALARVEAAIAAPSGATATGATATGATATGAIETGATTASNALSSVSASEATAARVTLAIEVAERSA